MYCRSNRGRPHRSRVRRLGWGFVRDLRQPDQRRGRLPLPFVEAHQVPPGQGRNRSDLKLQCRFARHRRHRQGQRQRLGHPRGRVLHFGAGHDSQRQVAPPRVAPQPPEHRDRPAGWRERDVDDSQFVVGRLSGGLQKLGASYWPYRLRSPDRPTVRPTAARGRCRGCPTSARRNPVVPAKKARSGCDVAGAGKGLGRFQFENRVDRGQPQSSIVAPAGLGQGRQGADRCSATVPLARCLPESRRRQSRRRAVLGLAHRPGPASITAGPSAAIRAPGVPSTLGMRWSKPPSSLAAVSWASTNSRRLASSAWRA